MDAQGSLALLRFISYSSSMTSATTPPPVDGFDAAVGVTLNQYLFTHGVTRAELGAILGVPGQSVSSRLRGKVRWTASDLALAAALFGIRVEDRIVGNGRAWQGGCCG